MEYLLPGVTRRERILRWPPEVFCLAASLLQASGAYCRVVDYGGGSRRANSPFSESLHRIGLQWRRLALSSAQLPRELQEWWDVLRKHFSLPVFELESSKVCVRALINLLAAADEACIGVGITFSDKIARPGANELPENDMFLRRAERLLLVELDDALGSTLCRNIARSKARVLPKMHTPQNGLTIRSLSHHLAYYAGAETRAHWYSYGTNTDSKQHSLNLLIVPEPMVLKPNQFQSSREFKVGETVGRGSYGLFTFRGEGVSIRNRVTKLLKRAERHVGRIDGVVLPELAVSPKGHEGLQQAVVTDRRFLITGVGECATAAKPGANYAAFDMISPWSKYVLPAGAKYVIPLQQHKHHRWKLEKTQIVQYGIASNLHPEVNWWEHISPDRKLLFVQLMPWLTMSVLVCEDLARPDPVGDLIRAVGPNLVIALLMDGPQLSGRWPGRYATSLADDPGCSVLTVTSLGMSRLSTPPQGTDRRNRVVALWKDPRNGTREIELPPDAEAIVACITVEHHEEWTADGRGDHGLASYPILAGYHPI